MPVVVGGMHRSGTSMAIRLLNVMGVYLGEESELVPATADNPDGYWEHSGFVDVNEEILHELGGGWDLPVALPPGWRHDDRFAPVRLRADELVTRFTNQESWGWKDPRNSLTLPFWQENVPQLKVVICLRHPLEVAVSLQRRGMFSYSLSLALWKAYNERILEATESAERIVTHYDTYYADASRELERVAEFVGIHPSSKEIEAAVGLIRQDRRSPRFTGEDLMSARVAPEVADLYVRMQEEADRRDERTPRPRGRAPIASKSGRSPRPFADLVASEHDPVVDRHVVDKDVLRHKLRTLEPLIEERDRTIESLEHELKEVQATVREVERERDGLVQMVDAASQRQEQILDTVSGIQHQVDRRGNELQSVLYSLHGVHTGVRALLPTDGKDHDYRQTVDRIRESVHAHVPQDATVLVASRGDEELIKLYGRKAWHFPCLVDGTYLGHHPANSEAAIVHLEAMRAMGARYLVLPSSISWWLDHYVELNRHLETRCRLVSRNDDVCRIYSLLDRPRGTAVTEADAIERVIAEFRARFDREPTILDWDSRRHLGQNMPELSIFAPTTEGDRLDYIDRTVDIVALGSGNPARQSEAERVAAAAVVAFEDERASTGAHVYGGRAGPVVTWLDQGSAHLQSVSIVVPCHDGLEVTRVCLETLTQSIIPGLDCEVLVIDDASRDGTNRYLREMASSHEWIQVLHNAENEGYLGSVNLGAKAAAGDILVFLNNDTISLGDWLSPLLRTFSAIADVGVVGGKLLYPDGRVQEAGGVVFSDGSAAKFGVFDPDSTAPLYNFVRDVDYCSGALLATPRALFEQLGGFDPAFAPGYYEDTDYCFRVREQGLRVLYQPASVIVHAEGATAGRDVTTGMKRYQVLNHQRFVERWHDVLKTRPARPAEPFDFLTLFQLAGATNHTPRSR